MSVTSTLSKARRVSADIGALTSGSPRRIGRRGKNRLIGKALGKSGFWRRLWR